MKNRVMQSGLDQARIGFLRLFIYAFLLVSLFPQQLIAQGDTPLMPIGTIIKYLGFIEDRLFFHVNIDNQKEERCLITIEDENGDVLYQQDFKAGKFTKTFSINKEELEGKNIVFILNRGKVKEEQMFEVATNTRIVQEVLVTKH